MGMDVFGIEPTADTGRYFRASIWQWRPLWEQMKALCGDFLSDEMLAAMAYNDGAGPREQSTCTKIADRLEQWLHTDSRSKFVIDREQTSLRVASNGCLVSCETLSEEEESNSKSPYSVTRQEIEEFIEFLRDCGGFSVW